MSKKKQRAKQKKFILMLLVGFCVVAFLTGCNMFTGPMSKIKHKQGDTYIPNDSLTIPPNTLEGES
jgi:hypothetical protein